MANLFGMKTRLFCLVAVLVTASFGVGAPAAGPKDKEGRSKPLYMESVIETARVPMRDGETLFVEMRRPVVPASVRVPIILTLSPYNDLSSPFPPEIKSLTATNAVANFFVPRGYARAIADVRGTRESSGCWDYGGVKERQDGYDLVEWLGTRPWSNGKVAMIGGSYEGTTANAAAVERPPHLATIVPIAAIDRWYDYAYMNGVRWLLNDEGPPTDEGFDTPAAFDFGLAVPPPIDARAAEWSDALADRYTPCDQADHTLHGYSPQPDYDAFWLDRDYRVRASNITIPVLVGHGLDDFNVKFTGGLEMYRRARGPKRLVIGQWTHGSPSGTTIGTWNNLLWRWFDKWLLGLETHVSSDPAVDVEDSSAKWHQESKWPPSSTRARPLFLGNGGSLGAEPGSVAEESFVDVPTMTEADMVAEGSSPARLLYVGDPVAKDTRIAGEPGVLLRMTSDSTSTHIAMLLADVAPDGSYERISRGFMNPRYRNGLEKGVDLVPGEPFNVSFSLSPADHVVPAGHRIAVAVASSSLVWAVPDLQRASNTVHLGGAAGSRITLPVVEPASVKGARAARPSRPANSKPTKSLPATGVGRVWWAWAVLGGAIALGAMSRKVSS